MKNRITIMVCSKDRHSEVSLLLQSLRTQSHKDWDLLLLDDSSGSPIANCRFLALIINMIRLEGHGVKLIRNEKSYGVCAARNKLIDEDIFNNPLSCRIDDDVLVEPGYLERLVKVIEKGYDIASGITPLAGQPTIEREVRFVGPIINKHAFNDKGELVLQNDDCGFGFLEEATLPTHQFRSCAIIKNEIYKKVRYKSGLSYVGFREEGFFSFMAIINKFKIGVDVKAKVFHLVAPSGGVRDKPQEYQQRVQLDDNTFKKWCKKMYDKHGDFLKLYEEEVFKNDNKN